MELSDNPASFSSVRAQKKLFYGLVIPLVLFIAWQAVLLTVTNGNGGFEGMGVVLVGVVACAATARLTLVGLTAGSLDNPVCAQAGLLKMIRK